MARRADLMSVRTMARVWAESKHAGSELLMLLAIADFADDEGNAYPAVTTLAAKCRMKTRNANYILSGLQASGELEVHVNKGPRGTNRYRIVLGKVTKGVQRVAGVGVQPSAGVQRVAGLQSSVDTPALQCSKPLHHSADEPSLNHQEPPLTSLSRPKAREIPNCPHAEIVQIFHEALPDLPRIKLLDTKGRKAKLAEFWKWVLTSTRTDGNRRAKTADEALAWIRSYFERAAANDFLMGRTPRSDAHAGWRCGLDFLLTDKGKVQVIERTEVAA